MYLVIELQTDAQGTVANLATQHATLPEAESKYYTVLAAAAISTVAKHAAVLMTSEGQALEARCYEHGGE